MLTAEHRRPLAAFLLVFAVACVVMGNGLRKQVVEVLISSGAPHDLISAIAPDLVLGQALKDVPPKARPEARPRAPREVRPTAAGAVADLVQRAVSPGPVSSATITSALHVMNVRPTTLHAVRPHTLAPGATSQPSSSPAQATPQIVPQPVGTPGQERPGVTTPTKAATSTSHDRGRHLGQLRHRWADGPHLAPVAVRGHGQGHAPGHVRGEGHNAVRPPTPEVRHQEASQQPRWARSEPQPVRQARSHGPGRARPDHAHGRWSSAPKSSSPGRSGEGRGKGHGDDSRAQASHGQASHGQASHGQATRGQVARGQGSQGSHGSHGHGHGR